MRATAIMLIMAAWRRFLWVVSTRVCVPLAVYRQTSRVVYAAVQKLARVLVTSCTVFVRVRT